MRIYLAARYSRRAELIAYMAEVEALGHRVTSRWLREDHELPIGASAAAGVRFAREDYEDLTSADLCISFTEEPVKAGGRNRGGRHVEFGIALGRGLRLVVIGHRENVFHYMPRVRFYASWERFLSSAVVDGALEDAGALPAARTGPRGGRIGAHQGSGE
jgi:hypothetical protein